MSTFHASRRSSKPGELTLVPGLSRETIFSLAKLHETNRWFPTPNDAATWYFRYIGFLNSLSDWRQSWSIYDGGDCVGVSYLQVVDAGIEGVAHFSLFDENVKRPNLAETCKAIAGRYHELVRRVVAYVPVGNRRLALLLTGLGFQREGVSRQRLECRDGVVDAVVYSLLREDLQ